MPVVCKENNGRVLVCWCWFVVGVDCCCFYLCVCTGVYVCVCVCAILCVFAQTDLEQESVDKMAQMLVTMKAVEAPDGSGSGDTAQLATTIELLQVM